MFLPQGDECQKMALLLKASCACYEHTDGHRKKRTLSQGGAYLTCLPAYLPSRAMLHQLARHQALIKRWQRQPAVSLASCGSRALKMLRLFSFLALTPQFLCPVTISVYQDNLSVS